ERYRHNRVQPCAASPAGTIRPYSIVGTVTRMTPESIFDVFEISIQAVFRQYHWPSRTRKMQTSQLASDTAVWYSDAEAESSAFRALAIGVRVAANFQCVQTSGTPDGGEVSCVGLNSARFSGARARGRDCRLQVAPETPDGGVNLSEASEYLRR